MTTNDYKELLESLDQLPLDQQREFLERAELIARLGLKPGTKIIKILDEHDLTEPFVGFIRLVE
jgi:hypothetical protein